ncbi:hypothetical protein GQ55_3G387200 [Panicum hallii var. hallii]|uniref:Uncharacterized protein n=1 Tax=Panicum hallii var. hallii TaxID=1504633 RepID=A0A2T7EGG2_9POAL|nr:hypothetical protein GQ55_3G387200 [Panicum hallii var. hallii]
MEPAYRSNGATVNRTERRASARERQTCQPSNPGGSRTPACVAAADGRQARPPTPHPRSVRDATWPITRRDSPSGHPVRRRPCPAGAARTEAARGSHGPRRKRHG